MRLLVIFSALFFSLNGPFNAFMCAQADLASKSSVMIDENGKQRIWSDADKNDLTYCLSSNFKELKPLMVSALKIATEDWMDSGNFTFRYVPEADASCDHRSGPSTRFRISLNRSRRYPYAARAFFPYDERKTITFKKSYLEKGFQELLRLSRHELGHVLGLRHEHIREENPLSEQCQEDDLFRGITTYDRNSIMHYSRCGGSGSVELSELDREGIAQLYPY